MSISRSKPTHPYTSMLLLLLYYTSSPHHNLHHITDRYTPFHQTGWVRKNFNIFSFLRDTIVTQKHKNTHKYI